MSRLLALTLCMSALSLLMSCASIANDLLSAAQQGNARHIDSLLLKGVDVDGKDKQGITALMKAAANGHQGAVKVLLANGAAVDAKANDRSTALMRAALGGHENVVRILIAGGANASSETSQGTTAVMLANAAGHTRIVALMNAPASELATDTIRGEAGPIDDGIPRLTGSGEEWAGLVPPTLLRRVPPSYTKDALQRKVEGAIILEVVILTTGTIGAIRIVRSLDIDLDLKAIQTVRQWRFRAARFEGEPVDVRAEIAVEFNLL